MLDMAGVTPQDYVIDLGSGDGRIVIAAAKRGARALGIEYDGPLVELSRRNAANEGVGDKATFVQADLFESDFSRGHGPHDVSALGHDGEVAAEDPGPEAGNAGGLELVLYRRLAA